MIDIMFGTVLLTITFIVGAIFGAALALTVRSQK